MASVQRDEVCEKCGNTEGIYYIQLRTNEEWFVCESCGWGYQTRARRFGESLLAELSNVVAQEGSLGNKWSMIDAILRDLLVEFEKNGYEEDDPYVREIQDLLNREPAKRGATEAKIIGHLNYCASLFAKKDGEVIMDYIEEAPRLYSIPLSSLRPMSELPGFEDGPSGAPSDS